MAKHKHKTIPFIVFTRIAGFFFFLIVLFLLNFLIDFMDNEYFTQAVEVLNSNIVIIIIMSTLFLVSEVFAALIFPFDLPAPIFAAVGSLFLVTFGLKVAEFIDSVLELNIAESLNKYSFIIYTIMFIIVLIGGYIGVFSRLLEPEEPQVKTVVVHPIQPEKPKTWKDIRAEFRQTVSDFFALIREKINRKRYK